MSNGNQAIIKRIQETSVLPQEWNREAWISALMTVDGVNTKNVMVVASFAGRYKLDPFVGQFHVIQGRPFVGRDGFLAIGTKDPRYVDHKFGKVYADDGYTRGDDDVAHVTVSGFGKSKRGKFLGAYCTIWTKGDDDVVRARTYEAESADFAEYLNDRKKQNWQRDPEGMVVIRCLTSAFRATFSLGGVYTVEEAPDVLEAEVVDMGNAIEASTESKKEIIKDKLAEMQANHAMPEGNDGEQVFNDEEQRLNLGNSLTDLALDADVDIAVLNEVICSRYDTGATMDLSVEQLKDAIENWPKILEGVAEYVALSVEGAKNGGDE
jgi:hypothetical protein